MKGCRPLTDLEVAAVLKELGHGVLGTRDRVLFILGLRTGFRISELLSITIGDVYQNGNYVDRITVSRRHMKGKKQSRSVPINDKTKKELESLISELFSLGKTDSKTFLFLSRKGKNKPMNRCSAWAMLKKNFAKCGLTGKTGTHTMRKTFAKKVYVKTKGDLMQLQEALGHRRITSTPNYVSFMKEDVDRAILDD